MVQDYDEDIKPPPNVISGEQIVEKSDSKHQNVDVLEDEMGYQEDEEDEAEEGESGELLSKLIENLQGNPALQNESIRKWFKLENISDEKDLHDYKNLLNGMAALFYTNHKMQDVTLFFYMWKERAL